MERQKSNDSIIPKCRYYGVFAVNKSDPTDIRGYVYTSTSTSWSRYFVKAFKAHTKSKFDKYLKNNACKELKKPDAEFMDFFKKAYESKYREGMTPDEARKIYYKKWYNLLKGEWLTQDVWNHLRSCPFDVPAGYELKIWRLNSTKLPVWVDLRYRTACNETKKIPYDKWCYGNAAFWVKEQNPGKVPNGPYMYFNWPKTVYIGPTERIFQKTVPWKNLASYEKKGAKPKIRSRSDYKRLKKQRECKLIAEKGSL